MKRISIPFSALIWVSAILWAAAILFTGAGLAWTTDYSRAAFPHWSDLDHDGSDTRQEEVARHRIVSAVWVCPYSGEVFTDPRQMDLDHIVPLAWAWRHGADGWTDIKRQLFANDPDNLELVGAAVNRAKGDRGPEQWLPPNLGRVGRYIRQFLTVCRRYGLAADETFLAALEHRYEKINNGWNP